MKQIKKTLKGLTLFLSALILLQGCTVYKSANVTLEEAVMSDTKVRIKTKDNQTLKYKKVGIENGNYYGLTKYYSSSYYSSSVKTEINIDNINKVQVKDKTLSTVLSVAIPVVIILGSFFLSVWLAYVY